MNEAVIEQHAEQQAKPQAELQAEQQAEPQAGQETEWQQQARQFQFDPLNSTPLLKVSCVNDIVR